MMGMYLGPAPGTWIYKIYELYYAYRVTDQTRWSVGPDVYPELLRLQYTDGRYLVDPYCALSQEIRLRLLGIPIERSGDVGDLHLFEVGQEAYTGKTQPLDLFCPFCGLLITSDDDPPMGCNQPHFKLEFRYAPET